MKVKFYGNILACVVVFVFAAIRVASAADESLLTLDDCIRMALENNFDILMASHEVKQSGAALSEVKSAFYPQLQFSSSFSRTKTLTYSFSLQPVTTTGASSQGSGLTPSASAASATSLSSTVVKSDLLVNSFRYGMSFSQLVFDFGKTLSLVRAQNAQVQAQTAGLKNAQSQIVYSVKKAYAELIRAKSLQRIQDALFTHAQEQLKYVKTQNQLGLVLSTDVLAAEVSITELEQTLLQTVHAVELAKVQLNSVLSRELDAEVEVDEDAVLKNEFPELCPVDECVAKAYQNRSELAQAESLKTAGFYQYSNAKKKKLPNVMATTNLDYKDDTFPPERFNWTVGIALDFPVYDGGRIQSGIKRTHEQFVIGSIQIEKLKSAVALEVKQAVLSYEEAKKKTALSEKLVLQTTENLKSIEGKFKQGAALTIEVLSAKTKVIQSQEQFLQARLDVFLSYALLEKVTGGNFL